MKPTQRRARCNKCKELTDPKNLYPRKTGLWCEDCIRRHECRSGNKLPDNRLSDEDD